MRALSLVALLLAACADPPATLLLDLRAASPASAEAGITVGVFDAHGAVVPLRAVKPAALPGTLIVRGLPSGQPIRVAARASGPGGERLLAGERVTLAGAGETRLALTLSTATPDGDGDGVPDAIDDCPGVADPAQADANADGLGDACAAVSDAAVGDAAVDLGDAGPGQDQAVVPSSCGQVPVALCEGFESGNLSALMWSTSVNFGKLSVGTDRAYRGTHSLHLHLDAVDAGVSAEAELSESQTFPANDAFFRAFVYMPLSASELTTRFFAVAENASPYDEVEILADTGNVASYTTFMGGSYRGSTTAVPRDRWFCLEWEVLQGASGAARAWVDGAELPELSPSWNLAVAPPFAVAYLGLSRYQPSMNAGPIDAWYDEIIVDTSRIGCTK